MECPICRAETPDVGKFCTTCGAALPVRCPSCGSANRSSSKFCLDCGHKLSGANSETTTKLATPSVASPSTQSNTSAERRQVTVMFSDLVGSTALSARMDPEDLREVISAYQKCVAETVRRFGGFVAKYMGDGVLVYFGYPQAHEDDAERAVRAGLELIAAVAALKTRAPCKPVSALRPAWSWSAT